MGILKKKFEGGTKNILLKLSKEEWATVCSWLKSTKSLGKDATVHNFFRELISRYRTTR